MDASFAESTTCKESTLGKFSQQEVELGLINTASTMSMQTYAYMPLLGLRAPF